MNWIDGEKRKSNLEPGLFSCLHFRAKVGNTVWDWLYCVGTLFLSILSMFYEDNGDGSSKFYSFLCDKWSEFPVISFLKNINMKCDLSSLEIKKGIFNLNQESR